MKAKGWKITTFISIVVIIGLIILNIFTGRKYRSSASSNLEKTIAVLPFKNLSNDTTQAYFCEGIREEILYHLQKMEALSVRSRTSADHYRNIDKQPTDNLDAYQAYLMGRYYAGQPHFTLSNWNSALKNYQLAVDIDSTFTLAYAELAKAHARLRYLREDLSEARLEQADRAASIAMQYGLDESRVHLALGYYYLYAYRDEDQALKQLEIAEKGLPNDVEVLVEKADIVLPQEKWEEAIELLERASEASPRDASILTHMTFCLWCTRQYEQGLKVCNQAISQRTGYGICRTGTKGESH